MGGNGDVNGHGDGDGAGTGTGTRVEVNEGAQDGNGDESGDGVGTGTGVKNRRRTQDENGEGGEDGSDDSSGDVNRDESNGNWNGDRIGEGGTEVKQRKRLQNSCRHHMKNGRDLGRKSKKCRKERVGPGPVDANKDNLKSNKEAGGEHKILGV